MSPSQLCLFRYKSSKSHFNEQNLSFYFPFKNTLFLILFRGLFLNVFQLDLNIILGRL